MSKHLVTDGEAADLLLGIWPGPQNVRRLLATRAALMGALESAIRKFDFTNRFAPDTGDALEKERALLTALRTARGEP